MTDEEFERRKAVYLRERRDLELLEEMQRFMPRHMRHARRAEERGHELAAKGLTIAQIEEKLFDGLPPDVSNVRVYRRARELGGELADCASGTLALIAGIIDGEERGVAAARRTVDKTRGEADRFGATRMRSVLRDAGWQEDELNDDADDR